jgi:hypothetical protein
MDAVPAPGPEQPCRLGHDAVFCRRQLHRQHSLPVDHGRTTWGQPGFLGEPDHAALIGPGQETPHLLGRGRVALDSGVAQRMAAQREFGREAQTWGELDNLIGRAYPQRFQKVPGQFQAAGAEHAFA